MESSRPRRPILTTDLRLVYKQAARRICSCKAFFSLQEKLPATFLMKLSLRRTVCKTFEKSLDTCPFQDDPELEKVMRGTASTPFTVVDAARERGGARIDDRAILKDPGRD